MARVFSAIKPTGDVHLGNYLGALRNWVEAQRPGESVYSVVDLHAFTTSPDAGEIGERTMNVAAILFAIGLDPDASVVFVQSHVPEHSQLTWLMECTASFGELSRMTQFKDRTARADGGFISAGIFTYPALMAADILLYDTDEVPVGDDQRQHVEITRDIAERFNTRYGEVFVIPRAVTPAAGARIMDLQNPTAKMSKSEQSDAGFVGLLDPPDAIVKRFKRAVTDSDNEVRHDREAKPGVSNLLEILAAATGRTIASVADEYERYGDLKTATAEAVVELLRPIQERHAELMADPGELHRLLAHGAGLARERAGATLERAMRAVGFTPPGA
ncbi:MAG: tryptophan--tRNA ligase [Thermoleophilia bacterium]